MGKQITASDLLELSAAERIQLVEELWDSLAQTPDAVPVTPAQLAELEERSKAYAADPDAGSSWDEVKARILGRAR